MGGTNSSLANFYSDLCSIWLSVNASVFGSMQSFLHAYCHMAGDPNIYPGLALSIGHAL